VRVAITGATGRLGSAVAARCAERGWEPLRWTRLDIDLDAPRDIDSLIRRNGPDVVVHCAAWTDVDGCARNPELAEQRNGRATASIAQACAEAGVRLLAVSTNEVFDGRRTDGLGYRTTDAASPGNAYGRSKLLGEVGAAAAFKDAPERLSIVRTSWLFGGPGPDFPSKILFAAEAARAEGRALSLVADELGHPTAAADLAAGIVDLIGSVAAGGIHHVVNAGVTSRAGWARHVLARAGVDVPTRDVTLDDFPRPSTPPRWAVLEPSLLPTIGSLRPWQDALDEDLARRGVIRTGGVPA
jgi:dTDP-4-dehydrorhamnose reductase